ncbi:EF-hand domain-containing protein [uncultured Polaribacter sp.]|uniref:EF-hand domain-containing protein n=1 Tax=uncultured Polaribacter sp. TaxID=174711 RepID=UPI002621897A|nr:EF-hand domain-containing protein [uncultured Polaribacter sp.]
MGAKENILRKIRILITNQFDSPEEAFQFFDSDKDGRLNKSEIKKMLRDAEISGFLSGIVANELLKGYDKNSDDTINWEEFKVAISELERDL